jgi:ubiquinone/menaquinone biosynthesis C-methylase UbiE
MPHAGLPREAVRCDICQVDDATFVCEAKSLYSEERFRLVRCRRCSLVYVNPRQDEAAKRAQLSDKARGTEKYETDSTHHQPVNRWILESVERYARGGRLLDVGCATGGLLREARARGWDVAGVEINQASVEMARTTYGLTVRAGTLEQARWPDNSFDVVTMIHTIEHVYHPSQVVAEVYRILKPGGLFYCQTPDFHHYATRLAQQFGFMKDTDPIDPTGHPYHFTPRTLATLVERQRFWVLRCGSPITGFFAQRNGHDGWRTRLLQAAALPAVWASRVVPIGSVIECIAQRPVD